MDTSGAVLRAHQLKAEQRAHPLSHRPRQEQLRQPHLHSQTREKGPLGRRHDGAVEVGCIRTPNSILFPQVDLLVGRKRKKGASANYIIAQNIGQLDREENLLSKVRGNFVGTHFSLFDSGLSPAKFDAVEGARAARREELGAVLYVRGRGRG